MNSSNDTVDCQEEFNIIMEANLDTGLVFLNMSYTREPTYFKVLDTTDYVKVIAYAVIIVGGLLGNIGVVLTVALNRSMRTTINYYVANLAVADAMICIFCMVPTLMGSLTDPMYPLGPFMCKFNTFMQMACLTCSVLTLSAISCDRFIAIMFPLHVRITKQRTSVFMFLIWIVSFLVSIPLLIVKRYYQVSFIDFLESKCTERWPVTFTFDPVTQTCMESLPLRILYYVGVTITLYFLPVVIMITAYSLILWKLWISEVPGERHAANINVQYRARKKVIKMVIVVLVAFIICWTPFQGWALGAVFGKTDREDSTDYFKWYAHYFAFSNSFINPIIYGGFNKTFREGFCIMLRCGFRRNRFTRPPRSRLTFTTGITSSPSRHASKILNGNNKSSSQKSNNMEMKPMCHRNSPGDMSPTMKDTLVSIVDNKDSVAFA